jgi:hypothetical protein
VDRVVVKGSGTMKIGSVIQKLIEGDTHMDTQTAR